MNLRRHYLSIALKTGRTGRQSTALTQRYVEEVLSHLRLKWAWITSRPGCPVALHTDRLVNKSLNHLARMFSIRDSEEPEDGLGGGGDVFPESPAPPQPEATPITFDLPSTTSGPTETSSTSLPSRKTPLNDGMQLKGRRSIGVDGLIDLSEDIWHFETDSPVKKTQKRNIRSRGREDVGEIIGMETPTPKRVTRRHSITTIEGSSVTRSTRRNSCVIEDESPIVSRKRKMIIDEEEEITDRCASPVRPKTAGAIQSVSHNSNESMDIDDILRMQSSPRKLAVAVEIPSRPKRKTRSKTPLGEVVVDNLPTPDLSPSKPSVEPRTPKPEPAYVSRVEDLENAINSADESVAPRSPQLPLVQQLKEVVMSPPKCKNVATILGKSPHRPVYRVGLSRKVNIEPLHGYLKKQQ